MTRVFLESEPPAEGIAATTSSVVIADDGSYRKIAGDLPSKTMNSRVDGP